jgi:hypothetical protein
MRVDGHPEALLQIRKGLHVIAVPVGLEDADHVRAVRPLQDLLRLEATVDDERIVCLRAFEDVDVVLHRPHLDLSDDQVLALVMMSHWPSRLYRLVSSGDGNGDVAGLRARTRLDVVA